MTTITLIIGSLFIIDGLFTLLNFDFVHSKLRDSFPNLNFKKLAFIEFLLGLGMVISSIISKESV